MRSILPVLLAIVLAGNLVAQSDSPRDVQAIVSSVGAGAKLKVRMKSGEVIRGRLSSVDQNGFTILTGRAKTSRTVGFPDVDSVVADRTHTPIAAWIVTGAIVAVVVIVVAVFAIERHNERG